MPEEITLGIPHMHDWYSKYSESFYNGGKAEEWNNHVGNPLLLHDRLSPKINLWANITNHHDLGWVKPWYKKEIREERNGQITHEKNSYFTYRYFDPDTGEWKRGAISWGVEASTDLAGKSHICHAFVPFDTDVDFYNQSREEALEASAEFPISWIAHPHAPNNWTPSNFIQDFIDHGIEKGTENHLEYSTGYWNPVNEMAKGYFPRVAEMIGAEPGRRDNIHSYEGDYHFIPGNDWHAAIGRLGHGLAITEGDDIVSSLEDGEIPLEEIVGMDVVERDGITHWWNSFWDHAKTFPESFPGLDRFFVPLYDSESQYEDIRDETLETYSGMSIQEFLDDKKQLC